MTVWILPVVSELVLKRYGLQTADTRIGSAEQGAVHRAARTPRADQIAAFEGIINYVHTALAANVAHAVLQHRHCCTLEQPGIKLIAADGMLHGRHAQAQTLQVHVQLLEGEEAVWVRCDVQLQVLHDFGCDPSSAQLQPRECFTIKQQHVGAAAAQRPSSRRPRGAAAHDQDIAAAHRGALSPDTCERGLKGYRYCPAARTRLERAVTYRS